MPAPPSPTAIACVFPGQGSQQKGMGGELFDRYPELCAQADEILGYSVCELCLHDADRRLRQTQFTQPALFVVNALTWLERKKKSPSPVLLAGHSLGEYNALFAAGSLSFTDGLRLVKKRGELMAQVTDGGMAAVLGLDADRVRAVIDDEAAPVDVANLNLDGQLVLAGPSADLERLFGPLERAGATRCLLLNVSGAFHSRYMAPCADTFADFVGGFDFAPPRIPVIANSTAEPYGDDAGSHLVAQIRSPVRWADTMAYFHAHGITELEELGPGKVLTKLWAQASRQRAAARPSSKPDETRETGPQGNGGSQGLGNAGFCRAHNLRHAYVVGSPTPGIRTPEMVVEATEAGLLAYLDDYRPTPAEAIEQTRRRLGSQAAFGVGLFRQVETSVVDAAIERGIEFAEAVGYRQITPALVRFRFAGTGGDPRKSRRLAALVTHVYQVELFTRPAPEAVIHGLAADGALTVAEASAARRRPVATDLCVMCGTGDGPDFATLLPAVRSLRDRAQTEEEPIFVGAGGALGNPEAIACAFLLGADFVRTGSVNMGCVESALDPDLRQALSRLEPGETTGAPAADGFALGARIQVMKKGSFFAARAQKLYELYRFHDSLDDLDRDQVASLEKTVFRQSLGDLRRQIRPSADGDPKALMADVFRSYLEQSRQWALGGHDERRVDFQVPCDESMAAFNRYVAGTELQSAEARRVTDLARRLLDDARALLVERLQSMGLDG